MAFPLKVVGTERECNDFVLQQWKHQRLQQLRVTAGLLKCERRSLSLEMDVSLQRKERWNGPTFGSPEAIMNWGLMSEKHPVPALLAMARTKMWVLLAVWWQHCATQPCATHLQGLMHLCSSVWREGISTVFTTGEKLSHSDGFSHGELLREKAM